MSESVGKVVARKRIRPKAKRWMLAAGTLGVTALAGAALPLSSASAQVMYPSGQLGTLHDKVVANTNNPVNGDTNPYGMAIVPFSSGNLVKGDLLVAEFNNAANSSGAGTSIVEINPMTGSVTQFVSAATLGNADLTGPVDIAINPSNDIVWVATFGSAADGSNSSYLIINSSGKLLDAETNASVAGNPSLMGFSNPFAGVWGGAVGIDYHTNTTSFYWTNIAGTYSAAGAGEIWRTDPKGPNVNTNSTFTPLVVGLPANAMALTGPKGLAYDERTGTLFFTESQTNAVYAIKNAATVMGPVTPQLVYQGGPLSTPQDIAIDPRTGHLYVVNGNAGMGTANAIVELTQSGQLIGVRDLAPMEAPGALFGVAISNKTFGGLPIIYYDNADESTLHVLMK
jgi:hypothetical protein